MQGVLLLQFSTMKTPRVNMLRKTVEHCWTPSRSVFIKEFTGLLDLHWVYNFSALDISYLRDFLQMPGDDVQDLFNTASLLGARHRRFRYADSVSEVLFLYFNAGCQKQVREYEKFAAPIIGRHLVSRLSPAHASERELLLRHLTNRLDLTLEFDTRDYIATSS